MVRGRASYCCWVIHRGFCCGLSQRTIWSHRAHLRLSFDAAPAFAAATLGAAEVDLPLLVNREDQMQPLPKQQRRMREALEGTVGDEDVPGRMCGCN